MKSGKQKRLVLAALWLCIGAVLPLLCMQIKEIGDSLLPMHFAVMLCGFTCGAKYGLAVGIILPFFRSLIFGMPPLYPNAVWMALELAAYGLVTGFLYYRLKHKKIFGIYISLLCAMVMGRIVWGISKAVLLGFGASGFTFSAFITGGIVDALPGIILQLILIPLIMGIYNKKNG